MSLPEAMLSLPEARSLPRIQLPQQAFRHLLSYLTLSSMLQKRFMDEKQCQSPAQVHLSRRHHPAPRVTLPASSTPGPGSLHHNSPSKCGIFKTLSGHLDLLFPLQALQYLLASGNILPGHPGFPVLSWSYVTSPGIT